MIDESNAFNSNAKSNNFNDIFNKDVLIFSFCVKIETIDGLILGFTDSNQNLEYNGLVYVSDSSFINFDTPKNTDNSINSFKLKSSIKGILSNDKINRDDLLDGKFDGAEVIIFLIDQEKLKTKNLYKGMVCGIKFDEINYELELKEIISNLNHEINKKYSPLCRAQLADSECGVNLKNYRSDGSVEKYINKRSIKVKINKKETDYYDGGYIEFISSPNVFYRILKIEGNVVNFLFNMNLEPQINDKFYIYPGCDKCFETCINKFHNWVNFRGEPFIASN